jgi:hypothetical protein
MRFWKGECSRAFTDWRGLHDGVGGGAWTSDDDEAGRAMEGFLTAERP